LSIKYEAVIGLEIHAQMLTSTKMFCGCAALFGSEPNTQTCPVCVGMPGVLPVINRKAVEFTIKAGLAMGCEIARLSRFARKNYFYPDLPKGYQVSQYELPICGLGAVKFLCDGVEKTVGITRIHMEEDAGKNIHEGTGDAGGRAHTDAGGRTPEFSFVDLNRAGVPLMEIVSEPDIRSPREAADFMRKIRSILRYLEVCDGNMEQGSLRCDANVSLRPAGQSEFGRRAEIKNINSFRFVEKAIEYEIRRQEQVLNEGGRIVQETRLFNTALGVTESMRSKEEAHDYRYFPEPDLVPITVTADMMEEIRRTIPELPDAKMARFIKDFGLPEYDADFTAAERRTAAWFEEAVGLGASPKAVSNWMMGEFSRLLNESGTEIEASKVTPAHLNGMLKMIDAGTISVKLAKTVFEEMFVTGKPAGDIVREKGLVQISDTGEIDRAVDAALAANPSELARYKGGEVKLMGFFVGQVMKATKGKANPAVVNEILRGKLG
jgi:aspartyl-tRNA(Asn)/glutamyl-tRNA(Gln) amidotransferase subunit B